MEKTLPNFFINYIITTIFNFDFNILNYYINVNFRQSEIVNLTFMDNSKFNLSRSNSPLSTALCSANSANTVWTACLA